MLRRWITLIVLLTWLVPPLAQASRSFSGSTSNYLITTSNYGGSSMGFSQSAGLTLSCYVKKTGGDGACCSAIFGDESVGSALMTDSDNKVKFFGGGGFAGHLDSASTVTVDGLWHWIAVTVDTAGNWAIYIDSTTADASGSGSVLAFLANSTKFYVGIDGTGVTYDWAGNIALCSVFKAVESSGNLIAIKASATPDTVDATNAVGAWYMCGAGGSLTDHSASANDLVVTGSVPGDAADPPPCGGGGGTGVKHRVIQ